MHGHHIVRREHTTEDMPPWAGIHFIHEVGSDELADTLKRAFPQCRTLRERKYMAAIEYLRHELLEIQSSAPTPTTAAIAPIMNLPLINAKAHNVLADNHVRNPQGAVSVPHSPTSSTHSTHQTLRCGQAGSPRILSVEPTTVASGHHYVFSAHDGTAMQQKTKRKMTAEEKLAYKATRKKGACEKCKRQKGKVRIRW